MIRQEIVVYRLLLNMNFSGVCYSKKDLSKWIALSMQSSKEKEFHDLLRL